MGDIANDNFIAYTFKVEGSRERYDLIYSIIQSFHQDEARTKIIRDDSCLVFHQLAIAVALGFLDAEALGIPGVIPFLDRMIVLDFIIANEDRHLNNFGAVRDAETLEWRGMAPIYDSGSSLGYDKSVPMMRDRLEVVCKPFKKHHEEQLKLVSSFDWIDFTALANVGEMITDILSDGNAKDYMEENRVRVIAELTERRIKNLEALANSKTHKQTITTDDEVGKNIAASYEDKK